MNLLKVFDSSSKLSKLQLIDGQYTQTEIASFNTLTFSMDKFGKKVSYINSASRILEYYQRVDDYAL